MKITVLRLGIDTLEASIGGHLTETAAQVLTNWKARAQELDAPQYAPLSGLDFAVQGQGAKPYAFKVAGDEATIRLTASTKIPGAAIRLSALGLALYEPLPLYELIAGIVADWFGPRAPGKLSRIDVAADFQGFDPSKLDGARFVCSAVFRPIYPNVDAPETYMFGKGPLVVRVYNKTKEIAQSGKTWLPALWAQHPGFDPEADVWRYEVQLRRDVLREIRYPEPEPAIEDMAAILNYGLSWADLRIPEGKSSNRWPRHPAWEALAAATGAHTTLTRAALEHELAPLARIIPAVAGYTVSAGAGLDEFDFDRIWAILGQGVRARLVSDGAYADAVRTRQIERIGKGDVA